MSRSRRKVTIFAVCNSKSEKADKRLWHKRLRGQERTRQASAPSTELDAHMPVHPNEVSSVWSMSKDGHIYRSVAEQARMAERVANHKVHQPGEPASLKQRLIHKYMGM